MNRPPKPSKPFDEGESRETRAKHSTACSHILLTADEIKKPPHQFYLSFVQGLRYEEVSRTPFAAATFTPEHPDGVFLINPRNAKNLAMRPMAGTIVHELLHIIFEHPLAEELYSANTPLSRRLGELAKTRSAQQTIALMRILAGQAMDMAINPMVLKDKYLLPAGKGLLTDDPEFEVACLTPAGMAKQLGVEAPPDFLSWREYASWMLDVYEKKRNDEAPCPRCGGTGQVSKEEPLDGDHAGEQPEPGDRPAGDDARAARAAEAGPSPGCCEPAGRDAVDGACSCPACGGDARLPAVQAAILAVGEPHGHESWQDWSQLDPVQQEALRHSVAAAVEEAARAVGGEGALPGHVQAAYRQLVKVLERQVDWTQRVAELMGSCGAVAPTHVRRLNKHDMLGLLGMKPRRALGVVVDESGSQSNAELGYVFAEIKAIAELYDVDVFVVAVSEDIVTQVWRYSEQGAQEMYERNGCGGTNMRPGVDFFLKEIEEDGEYAVGGILVASDGELDRASYIARHEILSDTPLFWLFTRPNSPFEKLDPAGEVIYADLNKIREAAAKTGMAPPRSRR